MVKVDEAVSAFRKLTQPFEDIWRSLDVRVSFCRRGSQWYNVFSSIRLSPDPPGATFQIEPREMGDFFVGHFSAEIAILDSLLREIEQSTIVLAGRPISLTTPNTPAGSREQVSYSPYSWETRTYEPEHIEYLIRSVPRYRVFAMRGRGASLSSFYDPGEWERLGARLLASDPHFHGVPDLARSLIGYPWNVYIESNVDFLVLAPLYARFEQDMELKGTSLSTMASGPVTAKPEDFRIACTIWTGTDDRRFSSPFTATESQKAGNQLVLRKDVEVGGGQSVELFLLFRNEPVDKRTYLLPSPSSENPRVAVHSHFDLEFERLNRFLFPIRTDTGSADTFEMGVAWILHLCGFQVANYGLKGLSLGDEIDVLAFLPYSRTVLAVEATWRDPLNKDKLVKLRRRTDELALDLPGFELTAVVVTATEQKYDTETDEAKQLKIKLLRPSNLRELLNLAEQNSSPTEAWDYIERL